MKYYEKYKWLTATLLCLIVLATAIYAVTTWSQTTQESAQSGRPSASQLPEQNNMAPSLQAQPTGQNLNGGGSSSSLQTGNGTQQSSQSPGDIVYPTDPNPCRGIDPGGSEMMCQAP